MADRDNLDDAIIGSPGSVFETEDVIEQAKKLEEEDSGPQNRAETDLGDTSLPTDVAMSTATNTSDEKSAEKSTERSTVSSTEVSVEIQTEDKAGGMPKYIWSKKGYNVETVDTSKFGSHYHSALKELLWVHGKFADKRGGNRGRMKVEPPSVKFSRIQEVMRESREAYEKLITALFLDRDIRFSDREFEFKRSEKRKREPRDSSQHSGPVIKKGYYTQGGYEKLLLELYGSKEQSKESSPDRSRARTRQASSTSGRPSSPEQLRHPRRRHPTPEPRDEPLTEVEVANYALANGWSLDDKEIFLRNQAEAFERRRLSRAAPVASSSNSRATRIVAERIKKNVVCEAITQAMKTIDWRSLGIQNDSSSTGDSSFSEDPKPSSSGLPVSSETSSQSSQSGKEKFVIPRRPRK